MEGVEELSQLLGQGSIANQCAYLDISLLGGFREVRGGDECKFAVDDDALGMHAGSFVATGFEGSGVIINGWQGTVFRPLARAEGVCEVSNDFA